MKLIAKKETLKESIPLIALFSAFTIILTILGTYIAFLDFIIILLILIPSIFISFLIKDKYYLIYFISTLFLSLIINLIDISFTITFLLPSLIIGYLFGLFLKKDFDYLLLILISSLIYLGFIFFLDPLIKLIIEISFIESSLKLLNLNEDYFGYSVLGIIIFILILIGLSLSFFIIKNEIKKFNLSFKLNFIGFYIINILSIIFLIISLILDIINNDLNLLFLVFGLIAYILTNIWIIIKKYYRFLYLNLIFIPNYLLNISLINKTNIDTKIIGYILIHLAYIIFIIIENKKGVKMERKEELKRLTNELLNTTHLNKTLRESAFNWLNDDNHENSIKYLNELEEGRATIDELISFSLGKAKEILGETEANKLHEHALKIKAEGALYCDCDSCSKVSEILEFKDLLK